MSYLSLQRKIRRFVLDCFWVGKVDPDISIFCNNCIGSFVASDFRLPFNSPTVNLMMPPADYIDYISALERHIGADIYAIDSDRPYPVAIMGGGYIYILFITKILNKRKKPGEGEKNGSTATRCFLFWSNATVVP